MKKLIFTIFGILLLAFLLLILANKEEQDPLALDYIETPTNTPTNSPTPTVVKKKFIPTVTPIPTSEPQKPSNPAYNYSPPVYSYPTYAPIPTSTPRPTSIPIPTISVSEYNQLCIAYADRLEKESQDACQYTFECYLFSWETIYSACSQSYYEGITYFPF